VTQDATEGTTEIRIERLLSAGVEEVYTAWTSPASMARWLSPTGQAEVEADVRVGGRLRVVMVGEGRRIEHTGEYLTVEPPHRLVFTWRSSYTGERPSEVTVALSDEGGATRLVLAHRRLPEATAAAHEGGWGAILDRLADDIDERSTSHGR